MREWLELPEIAPQKLLGFPDNGPWFCHLGTADYVGRIGGGPYDRTEYRKQGLRKYENYFATYLGKFDLLVFTPYWDEHCPKLLPRELIRSRFSDMPLVVSDVTCDIDGSMACTVQENTVDDPVVTYSPSRHATVAGFEDGLLVTAVDNLPAQIAESCSEFVGAALQKVIPDIVNADRTSPSSNTRVAWVFSYFAGISGTIETLKVAGQKLELQGKKTALTSLSQPWQYGRLAEAKKALRKIAPLAEPLRILIVGAGNVGKGCRVVCDELGLKEITAEELLETIPAGPWFCMVDAPEITQRKDGQPFNFKDYVERGNDGYESIFENYLGKFDILLQGAYLWV